MTAPRERPILFSAPMVRAILDGRKTQTRRLYKARQCDAVDAPGGPLCALPSPYGSPGDLMWVRETWSHDAPDIETCRAAYDDASPSIQYGPYCRATEVAPDTLAWKPSIFMPRWASRITLEITEVRVQRLQEISDDDARAEGVTPYTPPYGHISPDQRVPGDGLDSCRLGDQPHRLPFADLWDKINGKQRPMLNDDGEQVLDNNDRPMMHAPKSWSSNPWVWAITFRMVHR